MRINAHQRCTAETLYDTRKGEICSESERAQNSEDNRKTTRPIYKYVDSQTYRPETKTRAGNDNGDLIGVHYPDGTGWRGMRSVAIVGRATLAIAPSRTAMKYQSQWLISHRIAGAMAGRRLNFWHRNFISLVNNQQGYDLALIFTVDVAEL